VTDILKGISLITTVSIYEDFTVSYKMSRVIILIIISDLSKTDTTVQ